jgi:hypothetical protein
MDFRNWIVNQWDRASAIGLVLLGALAILLGWIGVSGSGLPSEQIPYLASGAIFGIFLLGVGATLWLSADLRDEWRKLEDIQGDIQAMAARSESSPESSVATGADFIGSPDQDTAPEPSRHQS